MGKVKMDRENMDREKVDQEKVDRENVDQENMDMKKLVILAIETSCDETSVALVRGGREILSNVISSQIDIHKDYGGVVPEIASRHHLENINQVIEMALDEAKMTMEDVDCIGVTYGPGLVGALLIGIATAKGICLTTGKPLIGVNHIHGHISANYLDYPELEPPFTCLVVSGGHSCLVNVEGYEDFRLLGSSRDDAVGEAYDKVARVLGLGYPGGPAVDKLAKDGDGGKIPFKRVYLEKGSLDFSFSGTKTGVINYLHNEKQMGRTVEKAHVAASFQEAVLQVIVEKTMTAAAASGHGKLAVAGGVAANTRLREMLTDACREKDIQLFIPSPVLCTDNAAMIGCAAYYRYVNGHVDGLDLDGVAGLSI